MKLLSQRDRRWASAKLAYSRETIGGYGCAITAVAMLVNALRGNDDLDPLQVNRVLMAARLYGGPFRNYVTWSRLQEAFPDLAYTGRVYCREEPATQGQLDEIDRRLDQGLPVIIEVDLSPSVVGYQQHFVLVIGRDLDPFGSGASSDTNYTLADPWPWKPIPGWAPKPSLLCPTYGQWPAYAVCGVLLYDRAR